MCASFATASRSSSHPDSSSRSYHFSPLVTDSAPMIEAEGVTLFNANDAKFAGAPLRQILKRHPNIDFCFRSHSSANPRACYHTIDSEHPERIEDDVDRYVEAFSLFMAAVKPRHAIPFASNSCLLHDDVFHLNDLIQTPHMVADYFERFARERGLNTNLRVMAPGDRWDSETGFSIQDNDWFEDRPAKLEAYRSRVAPTLSQQAEKEARISVSLRTVERYFAKLAPRVPWFFTAKLKRSEVLLVAKAGDSRSGFAVDLHGGGKVREVQPADFDKFDMRIEFPAIILRQALAMNMFQHAGISKRVHYYATAAAMPKLKRFVAILDMTEAELFPLRANINMRTIRAILPRWREGLLYSRVMVDVARGKDMPDLEIEYLAELT